MERLDRQSVSGRQVRIESVGVCALDCRRVDVAVDLTPSPEGTRIELAIEEPSGAELVSATLIDNCQPVLDRRLHPRRHPEPGVHTLHVGVFYQDELIDHVQRQFTFALPGPAPEPGSPEQPA